MKNIILHIVLISVLLFSCERAGHDAQTDEPLGFPALTRVDGMVNTGPDTYLILLYKQLRGYSVSGTYYHEEGKSVLTPGTVDDSGNATEDPNAGIYGRYGNMYLSYVSPAIAHENGWLSFDPQNPFYCLPVVLKSIPAYGILNMEENLKLMDTRSKLHFNFYADSALDEELLDYEVLAPVLKGAGDGGVIQYFPSTRQIKHGGEVSGMPLTLTTVTNRDVDEKGILKYTGQTILPAAFYASKTDVQAVLGTSINAIVDGENLNLLFELQQNNFKKSIKSNLTENLMELKPMHEYTFNFIVYSTFVKVTLDIYDYSDKPLDDWYNVSLDGSVKPIESGIEIGFIQLDSWESNNLGNQII